MKIDISKAFDSVQWDFLVNTLKALNFPQKFVHWIQLCVTTASFSVQVNGELAGFFRNKRGLRQGCPLSPYLFVICMNVLSCSLDKAAMDRQIGYHPRCKNIKLTHLCFADDLMVFSDGKKQSMEGVLKVFDSFAAASGLCISLPKSTIFLAGLSDIRKEEILESFPFEPGTLPVRYLGLPLMTKQMSHSDYAPLLEQIRKRISTWTARFLSFAGRLQLLHSVISSITNFWIGAFRLPSGCIKEIEKLCSAFLWSGPELNHRKAKVAWTAVCKPKEEGGLGIRPIREANTGCCLKLIWRVLTSSSSLWVLWVRTYLLRQGSIWLVNEKSTNGSWMWRKIVKYRDKASNFYKVEINDGKTTLFWHDVWCNKGKLIDLVGARGFIDMGLSGRATIHDAVTSHHRRQHRLEIYNELEQEIHRVRLRGLTDHADVVLWKQKENKFGDKFISKSTWLLLRGQKPLVTWSKCVWFKFSTPKYSFITWLVMLNRLSTGDRMKSWNSGAQIGCAFCTEPLESCTHIFFTCPYSAQVWESLTKGILDDKFSTQWGAIIGLLTNSSLTATPQLVMRYTLQATIHALWRERNNRRHGEIPTSPDRFIKMVDKVIRNQLGIVRRSSIKHEECLRFWFQTR